MGEFRAFLTLLILSTAILAVSQQDQPSLRGALSGFDQEHDLAKKEYRLLALTQHYPNAGSALLNLAKSTRNPDTRWMSMRGMRDLHYVRCEAFLKQSLLDHDSLVRANAARVLGDLGLKDAEKDLLVMFAAENEPMAVEQASLALRVLNVRAAAPSIRKKITHYTWQTRAWLLQALGALGDKSDVPLIAGYLNSSDNATAQMSTDALEQLAGLHFGPSPFGPEGFPTQRMLESRLWWQSHKDAWPRCDDCHFR
jgi:hypothetical protein